MLVGWDADSLDATRLLPPCFALRACGPSRARLRSARTLRTNPLDLHRPTRSSVEQKYLYPSGRARSSGARRSDVLLIPQSHAPDALRANGTRCDEPYALLPRRSLVLLQNLVDELAYFLQLRTRALSAFALRRYRALERLTHYPTVNSELLRHSFYRSYSVLVFTTHLFEQSHFRTPFQPSLLSGFFPGSGYRSRWGWAKSNERNGPIQTSEHKWLAQSVAKVRRGQSNPGRSRRFPPRLSAIPVCQHPRHTSSSRWGSVAHAGDGKDE